MTDRRTSARGLRVAAAEYEYSYPPPEPLSNGEEADYPYVANYSKGLDHDDLGEVDRDAYRSMLRALCTGSVEDFERIPLGLGRPLTNPQAGLAYDLQGADAHALEIPPAPRIDSAENSGEAVELYWMALCRDVRFTDFPTDDVVADAATEMSALSDFRGPKQGGQVTPGTLFRGLTKGDLRGPYVSQFLLRNIDFGTLRIRQRQGTAPTGVDHMTTVEDWLAVQRGAPVDPGAPDFTNRRYIQTPRDLATYVHYDALYEAYLNACLILLGLGAPLDPGNPYEHSGNQAGFGTYGGPHILSLVTEVATRALKAVWYQKWFVHRRLRPEAFGGRVHMHLSGQRSYDMIDEEVLNSDAVKAVFDEHGTYLLPQAFPEGSPTHPSYGAGHATVAGACVTILKAWFDESYVLPRAQVPTDNGQNLRDDTGPDRDSLRVGDELDKVAANVAIGRNMAGVHWRSDYTESLRLGERVAIRILTEQKSTAHEDASFTLRRFDGTTITI